MPDLGENPKAKAKGKKNRSKKKKVSRTKQGQAKSVAKPRKTAKKTKKRSY